MNILDDTIAIDDSAATTKRITVRVAFAGVPEMIPREALFRALEALNRERNVTVGELLHIAHGDGREVPKMGAIDQPTRPTTTNSEPEQNAPDAEPTG